ncbi:MAG: hypothetical protein ABFQ89_04265 [Chloroflexota bacterium]
MPDSDRGSAYINIAGPLLIVGALVIGVLLVLWLVNQVNVGELSSGGAILGAFGASLILIPAIVGGIILMVRSRGEQDAQRQANLRRQILDMVQTQGKISLRELALEAGISGADAKQIIYQLVGLGFFTGYVNWKDGVIYSADASKIQSSKTCLNCGGKLELAGKGIIECPYCGTEHFI